MLLFGYALVSRAAVFKFMLIFDWFRKLRERVNE